MRGPQWCLRQARTIGPAYLALVETLFDRRVLGHLRAAKGLFRLGDKYFWCRLESAFARPVHDRKTSYQCGLILPQIAGIKHPLIYTDKAASGAHPYKIISMKALQEADRLRALFRCAATFLNRESICQFYGG